MTKCDFCKEWNPNKRKCEWHPGWRCEEPIKLMTYALSKQDNKKR